MRFQEGDNKMATIRIDYERVMHQADEVDGQAARLGQSIRELETLMDHIRAAWESPASAEFLGKCNLLREEMRNNQLTMLAVAVDVRGTAKRIRDEDLRSAEMAAALKRK